MLLGEPTGTRKLLSTLALAVALTLLSLRNVRASEPQTAVVFAAGKDGYPSVRIPSLLTTRRGTLLAFAEGRAAETDQAANQIILRRSSDIGRTWGPLQVIARDGKNSLNNPCAVEDRPSGRILMMVQSYPAGGKEFNSRRADNRPFRKTATSSDGGQTWTKVEQVEQLPDPTCMGSILRYGLRSMALRDAFSTPVQTVPNERTERST